MTEYLGEDLMKDISVYPDNVRGILEPELEKLVGTREAQRIYLEMVGRAWFVDKGVIVRHVGQDLAANALAPVVSIALLEGYGGGSYTARNYDVMMRKTPGLTRVYMDYGLWWFAFVLVICVCLSVLAKAWDWKFPRLRTPVGFRLSMFFTAALIVLWETMQGDCVQDYKQVIFVTELWLIWMLSLLPREEVPDRSPVEKAS